MQRLDINLFLSNKISNCNNTLSAPIDSNTKADTNTDTDTKYRSIGVSPGLVFGPRAVSCHPVSRGSYLVLRNPFLSRRKFRRWRLTFNVQWWRPQE